MHIVVQLGLQFNTQKLTLTPVQCLEFIGAELDILKAFLLLHRFNTLTSLIETIQASPQTSARNCLQLLGHMATCTPVTPHARFHMRYLQIWFRSVYSLSKDGLKKLLLMPSRVKHSLDWWKEPSNVSAGIPFTQPPPTLILISDVPLIGLGAHKNNHKAQGK